MRLSFFDWLAVSIAGRHEPVSKIVMQRVFEEGGAQEASVFGCEEKIPARAAALANGTTSHALDYDDTHFANIGHPSVAVLPAAVAVGEKLNRPLSQILDAALIGCEVAVRIGMWLGRDHYEHGFHQTATSGSFGAGMAAGALMQFDEVQLRHVLGLISTRASGLKSQFGTMGKPYHAGMAASNGVEAALLVAAGFTSRDDGLECAQGFAATHAGDLLGQNEALRALGRSYLFESVVYKYHACCHGLHAAIEALRDTLWDSEVSRDNIEKIEVFTHPRWLKVCNIEQPETALQAKFSFRFVGGMVLLERDTSALETYSAEACADAELIDWSKRIVVVGNEQISESGVRVVIHTHSGEQYEGSHDLLMPVQLGDKQQRIKAKAASLFGAEKSSELWAKLATAVESPDGFCVNGFLSD